MNIVDALDSLPQDLKFTANDGREMTLSFEPFNMVKGNVITTGVAVIRRHIDGHTGDKTDFITITQNEFTEATESDHDMVANRFVDGEAKVTYIKLKRD